MSLPEGYPVEWEGDVVLSDGATAVVRPIRPDDADRLVAFHGRQSAESVYYRFFTARPRLPAREVERLVTVDYRDRMALVAIQGDTLIGVARYDQWKQPDEAEVAFFVDDEHHGRGVATLLLEFLAVAARNRGFTALTASVLPENAKMLGVFRAAGFDVESHFADGVIEVRLDIEPTEAGRAAIESRATRAAARSVDRVLTANSIAVIGGSDSGSIGAITAQTILDGGFTGSVHVVNGAGASVGIADGHRTLLDIDDQIDVAVIAVPQPAVDDVLTDCIRKGVRGIVVVSAGFSETGPDGARHERTLVERARRHGLRVLGPNCLGVINTDPDVRLNASLVATPPQAGAVALSTQSGGLGRVLLNGVARRGMGLSHFVALGNKADISGNDLLQFWDHDERTEVILLHLESFGNPRRFHQIARSMADRKPIVSVTTGAHRSFGDEWPARATLDALVEQTGVISVDTLEDLLDVGWLLDAQPVPTSTGTLLVGNSGATLRIVADAATSAGLSLAAVPDDRRAELAGVLAPGSRFDNPIDLTHAATAQDYQRVLDALLPAVSISSAVIVHAPPIPAPLTPIIEMLAAVQERFPEIAMTIAHPDAVDEDCPIPTFSSPEAAARVLGLVSSYGARRVDRLRRTDASSPGEAHHPIDVDVDTADRIVAEALVGTDAASAGVERAGDGAGIVLSSTEADALLRTAGLDTIPRRQVHTNAEAVEAGVELGYPVVLKAGRREALSRTQDTGVALDIRDERELVAAYEQMSANLGDAMSSAEVQTMAAAGLDATVSAHQGHEIGAVVALGRGGAGATPRHRRPVRIVPVDAHDAGRLIAESELADLITVDESDAGSPNHAAAVDVIRRVAALADAVREIVQIELNPVIIGSSGAAITDAVVRIASWDQPRPPSVRRLR